LLFARSSTHLELGVKIHLSPPLVLALYWGNDRNWVSCQPAACEKSRMPVGSMVEWTVVGTWLHVP